MPFTLRNLREDLADVGSNFDGAPDLEFRHASKALELEQCGLSYQRIPPDYRFPYGHTHKEQEEVYVVVRGTRRLKLRRLAATEAELVSGAWALGRSSRPHRSPRQTPAEVERRVCEARERTGWGPRLLVAETGVAHSTISAILRRHGCSRAPRPARREV